MKRILEAPSRRIATIFNEVDTNLIEICNCLIRISYPEFTLVNYADPLNEPTTPVLNNCYLVKENGTVWSLTVEKNDLILFNGTDWEILAHKITEINTALLTEINAETAKIGDVDGGNYLEIREDGTPRLIGDGTAWKDMLGDLFGKRVNATSGKVDYDWDENAIKFQSGGSISNSADRVGANLQINHEFKVGSSIVFKPHIHWFQEVSGGAVTAFVLTMRYRLQRNNAAKTTAWTTVTLTAGTDDIFDFTGEADGTYNQLTTFPDIIVDCSVSDTFQFQVARTDSLGGNMLVYFQDFHGEVDSFGSDDEIAKAE